MASIANIFQGYYNGHKKNAMSSINWVISFVQLLLMIGIMKGASIWIQIFSAVVMVLLIIFYCGVYVYYMLKAPDRLQSESYNLQKQSIDTLTNIEKNNKNELRLDENQPVIKAPPG